MNLEGQIKSLIHSSHIKEKIKDKGDLTLPMGSEVRITDMY